jgi:hypothetical protein
MKINLFRQPKKVIPKSDDLILLVGVVNNEITKNGNGKQIFQNFDEAKKVFPELDAEKGSENFTWCQGYQERRLASKKKMVRFETRIAYEYLSR